MGKISRGGWFEIEIGMAYPDSGTNRDRVEMALVKIQVGSRQSGFQQRQIETSVGKSMEKLGNRLYFS